MASAPGHLYGGPANSEFALLLLMITTLGWFAQPAVACELCTAPIPPLAVAHADEGPDPDVVAAFGNPTAGWPKENLGDPIYLTYSYQNLLDGGLKDPDGKSVPAAQIRTAIEEAFQVWAEVAPLHFTEVPDDGLPYGSATQYGQLRFRHTHINGPDPPTGNPTTKARAYFPGTGGNSGDVEFDNGDPWALMGTTREPDILGAAIHEIGHTLGLTHSSIPGVNMYWIFKRHTGPGSGMLLADDIAAIQSVYGAGVGTVTPLARPIPEPKALALLLLAITSVFVLRKRRASPFAT